jgi:RNA polymerase sigma factor (sigma-70 family)
MSSAAPGSQGFLTARRAGANLKVMHLDGEIDEQRLVDLARQEPAAFAELYRRHVHAVSSFVRRRTGNAHDADDITAVTFERAFTKLHRYQPGAAGFVGWLYRIATNEIIDQARRRARQQSVRGQRALRLLHESETTLSHDATSADPALIAALDRLPDRYNTVLSLRYVAGLEPSDVAAQLNITTGNCAVLTHRALAALRALLDTEVSR